MIITTICEFCRWANDNNLGPCRNCGGHTEERLVKGRWRTVTLTEPRPREEHLDVIRRVGGGRAAGRGGMGGG